MKLCCRGYLKCALSATSTNAAFLRAHGARRSSKLADLTLALHNAVSLLMREEELCVAFTIRLRHMQKSNWCAVSKELSTTLWWIYVWGHRHSRIGLGWF